jgi:hypothetical protein
MLEKILLAKQQVWAQPIPSRAAERDEPESNVKRTERYGSVRQPRVLRKRYYFIASSFHNSLGNEIPQCVFPEYFILLFWRE